MGKHERLLRELTAGRFKNVKFAELERLLFAFGFTLARVSGSHHIFVHPEIEEIANVQRVKGEAKPYQVKQVLQLIERHGLRAEE